MGKNWLKLMNLLKKILIYTERVYHLMNEKKYLIDLLKKSLMNLIIKKKINPNNLIYEFENEEKTPKDFSNYQN